MTPSPQAIRLAQIEEALTAGKLTPIAAMQEVYKIGFDDGVDTVLENINERANHIQTTENP